MYTTVKLRKTSSIFGKVEKDAEFVAKFKVPLPDGEAQRRAYRQLLKDHPEENRMEWDIAAIY